MNDIKYLDIISKQHNIIQQKEKLITQLLNTINFYKNKKKNKKN